MTYLGAKISSLKEEIKILSELKRLYPLAKQDKEWEYYKVDYLLEINNINCYLKPSDPLICFFLHDIKCSGRIIRVSDNKKYLLIMDWDKGKLELDEINYSIICNDKRISEDARQQIFKCMVEYVFNFMKSYKAVTIECFKHFPFDLQENILNNPILQ